MMDASLKQRILCIICISIFGAFSAEKSVQYTRVNMVFLFYEKCPTIIIIIIIIIATIICRLVAKALE